MHGLVCGTNKRMVKVRWFTSALDHVLHEVSPACLYSLYGGEYSLDLERYFTPFEVEGQRKAAGDVEAPAPNTKKSSAAAADAAAIGECNKCGPCFDYYEKEGSFFCKACDVAGASGGRDMGTAQVLKMY